MHDLRSFLFYSYIAYGFFLPSVFILLFLIYKNLNIFLIPIIIIDTVLFPILLAILYWYRAANKRFWLYIIFLTVTILISIRNLILLVLIMYKMLTEFEKKRAIFSDAIDRQINILKEPEHPVWSIILIKQCCGLASKHLKANTEEYRWFTQTPFSHFCPRLRSKTNEIIGFEHKFTSPYGACLLLVNDELKVEFILLSIALGFGIFLMLVTWLFICQNRLAYFTIFKNKMQKQKKNSITSTAKPSIASINQEPVISEDPKKPKLSIVEERDKFSQFVPMKPETKRLHKEKMTVSEDV